MYLLQIQRELSWDFKSSGMWQHVIGRVVHDVSKDHDVFILKTQAVILLVLLILEDEGINTLRTGSFKLFKRPLPRFLTILTL